MRRVVRLGNVGTLRLILAFSVVAGHGDFWRPHFFVNASAAVVCFFVISGFYMALVLNEKYTNWQDFAKARFFRLYPIYYFFLLIELGFWIYDGQTFSFLPIALSLTLFGRDYFYISTYPPGEAMPLVQAWSIAVELQFYVLAAFAFKTPRGIFAVFGAGLALRTVMYFMGYIYSPLGTWLALNTLVFFGAGGLSYLLYKRIESFPISVRVTTAGLVVVFLLTYIRHYEGFNHIDASTADARFYPLYLGIALLTPFLFSLTKNIALDKFIGELSYPVYLSHVLVYEISGRLQQDRTFVLCAILALSLIAYLLVETPLNRQFRLVRRNNFLLSKQSLSNQHCSQFTIR